MKNRCLYVKKLLHRPELIAYWRSSSNYRLALIKQMFAPTNWLISTISRIPQSFQIVQVAFFLLADRAADWHHRDKWRKPASSFPFTHVRIHTPTSTDVAEEAVDLSNTCGSLSSFHTRWSKSSEPESLDLLSEKISGDLAAYHPPNMQIGVCSRASCVILTCVELVSGR